MSVELAEHVESVVSDFLRRSPLEDSTLILDGTGVNGHIQLAVLKAIGFKNLFKLKKIHLISGSYYSFLGFLSICEGDLAEAEHKMSLWDRNNRRLWHRTGFFLGLYKLFRLIGLRKSVYDHSSLEAMLVGSTSESFCNKSLKDLSTNISVWLYDLNRCEMFDARTDLQFQSLTLAKVARCCAAIPALYGPYKLYGREVIDPVFSPEYRSLLKQLRTNEKNCLVSNVTTNRMTDSIIWLKPHQFGSGKKMVVSDFARMILCIPNPRIFQAYKNAFK